MGLIKKRETDKDKNKEPTKKLEPMKENLLKIKLWDHYILPNE